MWRILKANLNAKGILSNSLWLIVLFIFWSQQDAKINAGQMIFIGALTLTILYWWAPNAFQTQHFPAIHLPITLSRLALARLCYVPLATLLFFLGAALCAFFWLPQEKLISIVVSYLIYLCVVPTVNACGLIAQDLRYIYLNAGGRWLSFLLLSFISLILFACAVTIISESDLSEKTWLIDLAVEPIIISAVATANILFSWLSISFYRKRKIYISRGF